MSRRSVGPADGGPVIGGEHLELDHVDVVPLATGPTIGPVAPGPSGEGHPATQH